MPALREVRAVSAEPFKSTPATPTPSQRPTTTLPVGVIAGSLAGGVALAIVIVLAWTYWGKSFQHHQRKQVCTVFTTRDSIRRRSSCHTHRKKASSIRSLEKLHLECKDEFSKSASTNTSSHYDRKSNITTPDAVGSTSPSPKSSTTQFIPSRPTKSSPSRRMLRKHKRRKQAMEKRRTLSPIIDVDAEAGKPASDSPFNAFMNMDSPTLSLPPTIIHKPSFAGSSSVYSTQSGEERQFGDPTNFVLTGLDMECPISRPPLAISHKPSNVSSVYSNQSGEERIFGVSPNVLATLSRDRIRFSTRTRSSGSMYSIANDQSPPSAWAIPRVRNAGEADGHQPSRLSQVSCASVCLPSDNLFTVGIACGGECDEGLKTQKHEAAQ